MIDLDRALHEARDKLDNGSPASAVEVLRDLTEAVQSRRASARHHADRILRASDGDEECRDTVVDDAVALAEGVAMLPRVELMGEVEVAVAAGVAVRSTPLAAVHYELDQIANLPDPVATLVAGRVWLADDIRALVRERLKTNNDEKGTS